ncbi:MAG: hypothetical protein HKN61_08065 [Flavobacteriaceae bacterium]|nr:hypothetical protein [Flavobacteriaceae bacterium]
MALLFLSVLSVPALAQLTPGVYFSKQGHSGDSIIHELKIADGYMVHSVYELEPAKFIKTLGGPYTVENDVIEWELDFNSNHPNDGIENRAIPFRLRNGKLNFEGELPLSFHRVKAKEQALDGAWLFATRGPDTGQERRGESNPRKTLKILKDGYFQWIAFNSRTFEFFGTGGGTYRAKDGKYMEMIRYFSRDPERVGARLDFTFEIKGTDWHHTGKNSRGEPLYEIWAKRK